MPDLPDDAKRAMPFWGVIERAASERWTTERTWEAIREHADAMGYETPGVSATGVARLRAYATSIQVASGRLDRAERDQAFTHAMAASAPWGRSEREQGALSIYQVRYQHTTMGPDGLQTEWRSQMYVGSIPGTVGEILDDIDAGAAEDADRYEVAHIGVANLSIMRV